MSLGLALTAVMQCMCVLLYACCSKRVVLGAVPPSHRSPFYSKIRRREGKNNTEDIFILTPSRLSPFPLSSYFSSFHLSPSISLIFILLSHFFWVLLLHHLPSSAPPSSPLMNREITDIMEAGKSEKLDRFAMISVLQGRGIIRWRIVEVGKVIV